MTRSILWCTLALSLAQSSLVKADNLHAFSLPIQRRQPECVSSVNVTQVYHELVCGLDSQRSVDEQNTVPVSYSIQNLTSWQDNENYQKKFNHSNLWIQSRSNSL